jgi:processive 1,2-diacylglycerol beta-glucosyltransferase
MWVHAGITGYFAANQEVAFRMRAHGIPADAIHVTGIPIMPAFAQTLSRTVCAQEFNLDPSRLTIILMGGGAGLGNLDELAARLLDRSIHIMNTDSQFQLVVLAGKNIKTLQALQELAQHHPERLFPFGFTSQVERLMACADLVITKPGGLTTSECLAMGLPMIVNAPIPGQEERNADFVMEQGVALKAIDPLALAYRVQTLVAQPDKLSNMAARAKSLGKPNAAKAVFEHVIARLI